MSGPAELWQKGDYREIARELEPVAAALVARAGVSKGARVLDVAAGDGNVAVEAARLGAAVMALEIAPALVARGRERTAGLAVEWVEADATELPFPDDSFDAVLSAFGSVYLPDPAAAAREHARVTQPGGVVGIASWTPGSFQGLAGSALARALGREGVHQPASWGDPHTAEERLAPYAEGIAVEHGSIARSYESVEAWMAFAERTAPPLVAVRETLGQADYEAIRAELIEIAGRFATRSPAGIDLEQEYLLVIARVAR